MALKVKVGLIGAFDMLKFKNMTQKRNDAIENSTTEMWSSFPVNVKAAQLHPEKQDLIITEVKDMGPGTKNYTLMREDKKPVAYFRAGQYLSVQLKIGNSPITRPYSISSSPQLALEGKYVLTVKDVSDGFAAPWILKNWKVGTALTVSAPFGSFYYEGLRDCNHVIAVAGGSGITPFISMAEAIKDGTEDFKLTIIYGNRTKKDILFKEELDEIQKATDKIKVVHVLSDEENKDMEKGFITASLITKYATKEEYNIFVCGPCAMYSFLDKELPKLALDRKFIRQEVSGAQKDPWNLPFYPKTAKDKIFKVSVTQCGNVYNITADANETVLVAMEKAGIAAPSKCRGGECGFCHSRLISGTVAVPEKNDGSRAADKEFGYIHPCCSFPTSDLEIEIPAFK